MAFSLVDVRYDWRDLSETPDSRPRGCTAPMSLAVSMRK